MKKKIFRSMLLILLMTLFLSVGLFVVIYYNQLLGSLKTEVRKESLYIERAYEQLGVDYLKEISEAVNNQRITMIDNDGNVIYDSQSDIEMMENHNQREEVVQARNNGNGEALRRSETFGQRTFYYAVDLDHGIILRLSQTTDTAWYLLLELMPYVAVIGIIILLVILYMIKPLIKRLIEPINRLDLEEPLKNDVYEELRPLLISLDHQNKEKERMAKMRKEFSANVSHELKTPLTSILGYGEIMKSGLVKTEDMKDFSGRIYDEAKHLIRLIEDIIKVSKLDEEEIQLEKENINLFALTKDICRRLRPQVEAKDIKMEIIGEDAYYEGIRVVIEEMVYNICENAIKYNKDHGIVKIWVGDTLDGLKIIVKDNGIGIAKEHQGRIFERFYRVDKSHSKTCSGTGLGLSIVKHGALIHNATLHISSELDIGTKVEINWGNQKD